ncbi:hypothetical protein GUJ93_ZPchr0001g31820 [Zizania palustris]|uniref:Uncharacterized protein n=1 Tax=Zizania palustris TaxID=103762 RepID=A0A8J5SA87_ZIZPA|nr:hypothetical protein GUJ93_ZPchr0001g31820 [Zizania palustris]
MRCGASENGRPVRVVHCGPDMVREARCEWACSCPNCTGRSRAAHLHPLLVNMSQSSNEVVMVAARDLPCRLNKTAGVLAMSAHALISVRYAKTLLPQLARTVLQAHGAEQERPQAPHLPQPGAGLETESQICLQVFAAKLRSFRAVQGNS